MSEVLDRGSLLFASIAALAVAFVEGSLLPPGSLSFYVPLLIIAAIYVPGTLAISRLFGYSADYGSLLTCAAMAWSASQIPLIAAFALLPRALWPWFLPPVVLYFVILMFFAVRNIFGMHSGAAAGTVALSFVPLWRRPGSAGDRLRASLAGVAVLRFLRLVFSRRRVGRSGSRTAQPAAFSQDAGGGGHQSARWGRAVSTRPYLSAAPSLFRSDRALPQMP